MLISLFYIRRYTKKEIFWNSFRGREIDPALG